MAKWIGLLVATFFGVTAFGVPSIGDTARFRVQVQTSSTDQPMSVSGGSWSPSRCKVYGRSYYIYFLTMTVVDVDLSKNTYSVTSRYQCHDETHFNEVTDTKSLSERFDYQSFRNLCLNYYKGTETIESYGGQSAPFCAYRVFNSGMEIESVKAGDIPFGYIQRDRKFSGGYENIRREP